MAPVFPVAPHEEIRRLREKLRERTAMIEELVWAMKTLDSVLAERDELAAALARLTAAYEARGERIATLERLVREACARHGEPLPLAYFLGIWDTSAAGEGE